MNCCYGKPTCVHKEKIFLRKYNVMKDLFVSDLLAVQSNPVCLHLYLLETFLYRF